MDMDPYFDVKGNILSTMPSENQHELARMSAVTIGATKQLRNFGLYLIEIEYMLYCSLQQFLSKCSKPFLYILHKGSWY